MPGVHAKPLIAENIFNGCLLEKKKASYAKLELQISTLKRHLVDLEAKLEVATHKGQRDARYMLLLRVQVIEGTLIRTRHIMSILRRDVRDLEHKILEATLRAELEHCDIPDIKPTRSRSLSDSWEEKEYVQAPTLKRSPRSWEGLNNLDPSERSTSEQENLENLLREEMKYVIMPEMREDAYGVLDVDLKEEQKYIVMH